MTCQAAAAAVVDGSRFETAGEQSLQLASTANTDS
jgi:hypothetical protein